MFEIFKDRSVLITGHTGFCGSWLSFWLKRMGANVCGLARPPHTNPNLSELLGKWSQGTSIIGDITDSGVVADVIQKKEPEIVFHLAAQSLVVDSYLDPIETYRTNVVGTAEVMEAIRQSESVKAAVFVTTDKVYQNNEWIYPYREADRLGGKDPYSSSKAASELVISSYIQTMLEPSKVLCASARGGNIIGGGDWSANRLIPDIVRAIVDDEVLTLRSPAATRPWQHVLALCHGYMMLAERLYLGDASFQGAWNFGPEDNSALMTRDIVETFGRYWKKPTVQMQDSTIIEAQRLALDSSKARLELGWIPPWSAEEAVQKTASWYEAYYRNLDMTDFTMQQIDQYSEYLEQ